MNLPDRITPYQTQWDEHWEMRKKKKLPTSAKTKVQASNTLLRLSKNGYDIGLLLDRSTDNGWRSFWRHPECMRRRPVELPVVLTDLHKSNRKRAAGVLARLKVKRISLPKATSKLEMFQKLEKHLRERQ